MLIINASPRTQGNSAFLAEALQRHYTNSEIIHLANLNLKTCTSCMSCKNNNSLCIISDDMTPIYKKLLDADKIVFISPNIFGFLSSLGKIFTDRFYCLKTADKKTKFDEGKKVIFLFNQGSPNRDHGSMAVNWAKNFFENYGLKTFTMIIPNCSVDSFEGAEIKLEEIKMNISMF